MPTRFRSSLLVFLLPFVALAVAPTLAQPAYMVADLGDQVHRDREGTSFPMEVAELAGVGYYFHHDGIHGSELWRTDGSALGTYLLRDICPGICGARDLWANTNLAAAAGVLFFTANDGVHGNEPLADRRHRPGNPYGARCAAGLALVVAGDVHRLRLPALLPR